jgi:protein-S-isoprenylcysteine O-methyltransferase Ste14
MSGNSNPSLREQLLKSNRVEPSLRAEYERRLNAMLEMQISKPKRLWMSLLVLINIVIVIGVTSLAITESVPPMTRVVFVAGGIFAIVWIVYLLCMVVRGRMDRRWNLKIGGTLPYVFSLIMCILMALGGMATEQVLLMGMLVLLPTGLILVRSVIEESHLRTEERLLELEYRLTQLAEQK